MFISSKCRMPTLEWRGEGGRRAFEFRSRTHYIYLRQPTVFWKWKVYTRSGAGGRSDGPHRLALMAFYVFAHILVRPDDELCMHLIHCSASGQQTFYFIGYESSGLSRRLQAPLFLQGPFHGVLDTLLSLYLAAVGNPSPKRNQFLSPRDEEERRRLLKQLVAPKGSKDKSKRRESSACVFDSMIIKAARSAENLPVTAATASATAMSPSFASETGARNNFRKESTVSLQVCIWMRPNFIRICATSLP